MTAGYVCAEVGRVCTTIIKYETISLYSTKCNYNINPFHTPVLLDTCKRVLLASSEDRDEMPHYTRVSTVCLDTKNPQGIEIHVHNFIDILTGNPLKYKIDTSILFVSICMG